MGNIILIGFMASGKTTIGKELAKQLGYRFLDTDAEVERREGCTIAGLFANRGETYFRKKEREVLQDLSSGEAQVISTGGGIITQPENVAILQKCRGMVVWLDVTPEEVLRRTKGDATRPLLQIGNDVEKLSKVKNLLAKRYDLYRASAHYTVAVDGKGIDEVTQEILQRYGGKKMKIWVINGPNLNFLGIREPGIYGKQDYAALVAYLEDLGRKMDVEIKVLQSNHEGVIIDWLQEAHYEGIDGIVMNSGAFTHYSYALRDAISSIAPPVVEVHLSDIYAREAFRHVSVIKEVCIAQFSGLGFGSYKAGLEELCKRVGSQSSM